MKTKNLFTTFALCALLIGTAFANNDNEKVTNEKEKTTVEATTDSSKQTIVGVAAGNENFSTLVAAVKAAGLVDTLNSEGPFTVFAPTNAAFDKLPEGTVGTLLKPENKGTLTAVLTYHVVAGKFDAAAVVAAIKKNKGSFTVPTVQGGSLTAMIKDGNVVLKDAKGGMSTVVITDVAASNGIIHAIDSVVMPE
ncbi:MAG: fasciclin domain-containing protein [Bacteroidia bacterium]|nr:fasciclin domain-containing protein [Bacteroidia bacterium]MBT8311045.1 fasciclin domain-containing protein [Bacteroidia bacterium]NND12050.1 fasciclin domain-containing protein [Flavobacteriaceae bacterium]NNK28569.1 fasciclin domain-containing protein [Flavobacteriaceae bacterium]NNL61895.1 fasciclin domain-containing protein [Flavobacteriaceae bacterium]